MTRASASAEGFFMRWLYLFLAVLGTALPYSQFLPWVAEHGLNLRLLFMQLFLGHVSAFFGLDAIVSALVLLVFIFHEGPRRRVDKLWLPVVATCVVGVSCGFPLFLYLRELASRKESRTQ
jgi:Terpene cyclase DEP1